MGGLNPDQIEIHLQRLLSQLDKNPLSPYYGCFHRDFWHYKMASDFPSSIYQMGTLSLALAHTQDFSINFHHNKEVFELIKASIKFWASIQNKDGSFNEWYPNEHSIVATAFTAWGISESLLILKPQKSESLVNSLKEVWRKIGFFLKKNIDIIALNHTAGAIAALYNFYLLTGDQYYLEVLSKNKQVLLSNQDSEGWYSEYGDPDIGYQSLSIFFLAHYWHKSKDKEIFLSLEKAVQFLLPFVHPDGTSGGEYASRNTKYFFRYGLHLLSSEVPEAGKILNALDHNKIVNINCIDDRYFIFFFLPDFMLMQKELIRSEQGKLEHLCGFKLFNNCGLLVHNTQKYQMIVNLKKGGALKLFDKSNKELVVSSLGYMYAKKRGEILTTLGFGGSSSNIDKTDSCITITINALFLKYSVKNPLAKIFIFFRLFNLVFERFSFIHKLFDRYLKLKKVKTNRHAKSNLQRKIVLTESAVKIIDELKNVEFLSSNNQVLYEVSALGFRFSPTSRYSHFAELQSAPCTTVTLNKNAGTLSERSFVF